jgi:RNA polymerase sigma-70 factor (ECF subfamily)
MIGRDEALDRLARTVARKGYAIARDLLGDAGEAEDAVQESLARACAGWRDLRDTQALEAWFYRVLTNLCLRTLRRRRIVGVFGRIFSANTEDDTLAPPDPPDPQPTADDALARIHDVARTLRAVDRLSPMQRTVVVLRYGHDQSVEEVAAALGIGAGSVKTHLVRALDRLRDQLGGRHAK